MKLLALHSIKYYICGTKRKLLNFLELISSFISIMKKVFLLTAIIGCAFYMTTNAQTRVDKNKRSRYFKQNTNVEQDGFFIEGFEKNYDERKDRDDVEKKADKEVYNVRVKSTDKVGKYQGERKINTVKRIMTAPIKDKKEKKKRTRRPLFGSRTTDKVKKPLIKRNNTVISNERVIYMSDKEKDYATTVVRKRYTSLDILADDLDISKYQNPVFKGICLECDRDVDQIITNKNLSSLEKNYRLKQCYMLRDKRLREMMDSQQYKKWLRIKDEDEYLILTKDPELKDGVYK